MKDTVYIVTGYTGEYADQKDWPVAAYLSENVAETHCAAANQWAKDNGVHMAEAGPTGWPTSTRDLRNPFDDEMALDYTGTEYRIVPVEFGDAHAVAALALEQSRD